MEEVGTTRVEPRSKVKARSNQTKVDKEMDMEREEASEMTALKMMSGEMRWLEMDIVGEEGWTPHFQW